MSGSSFELTNTYSEILKEVVLERMSVRVRQILSRSFLDYEINISNILLDRLEYISLDVEGYVWGEHLDRIRIKYPADWKEAFKERWFPKKLLERFPVKYTVKVIDVEVIYPNYKYALPKEYRKLHLRMG